MAAGGALLSMLALGADLAAHKLVTFVPTNAGRHLPIIQGELSVWDARNGAHLLTSGRSHGDRPANGRAIACLASAYCFLVVPGSFRMFGTGTQALHHVRGHRAAVS